MVRVVCCKTQLGLGVVWSWYFGGGGEATPFCISVGDCLLHGFTAVVGLGSASTMLHRVRFK